MHTQLDQGREFIITADASNVAIEGIRIQIGRNGKQKMMHAFTRVLTGSERNYLTTDKGCLVIAKSLEKFRKYLTDQEFRLRTNIKCSSTYGKLKSLRAVQCDSLLIFKNSHLK